MSAGGGPDTSGRARSGLPGFDAPLHRDWLFVAALLISTTGGPIRLYQGNVWWEAVTSVFGGVFLIGVIVGSIRELVRGLVDDRERRAPKERHGSTSRG